MILAAHGEFLYGQNRNTTLILSEDYTLDHWNVNDGLPVNSIIKIIRTSDGYLWLATPDGLVRFDGIDFKVYTTAAYPNLIANRITDIAEGTDGTLFVMTVGAGISAFKDQQFTIIAEPFPSLSSPFAMSLHKDSRGWIWMPAPEGLLVYKETGFETIPLPLEDININWVSTAGDSSLWFRNHYDVYYLQSENLRKILTYRRTHPPPFVHKQDEVFIAGESGIYSFLSDSLRLLENTRELSAYQIGIDSDGNLMAGTGEHYFKYRDHKLIPARVNIFSDRTASVARPFDYDEQYGSVYASLDALVLDNQLVYKTSNAIVDYIIDPEGSIWIATSTDGLYRLKRNLFTVYNNENGLPNSNIYPVYETRDSSIWVGTTLFGIARIKNGEVEAGYTINDIPNHSIVRSILQRSDGTLLIGVHENGLFRLIPGTKKFTPVNGTEFFNNPSAIYEDGDHNLWVGAGRGLGLYKQEGDKWIHVNKTHQIPTSTYQYITQAPNGDLWFATLHQGIVRYDGTYFHTYTQEDGLSSNQNRAIHFTVSPGSGKTILWLGSEGNGLDRIEINNGEPDFSTLTTYRKKNGLFDNSIHRILDDGTGRFWISTNRGIFHVAIDNLEAFYRKEISSITTIGYTEKDGLLNREANGGVQSAGIKSSDGRLWFPTQNGVAVVDPADVQQNKFIPPVVIRDIFAGDEPIHPISGGVELPADWRDIEISYASLSYMAPGKNRYRYMMEGYDTEWRNADHRRTAYYTNLPAGEFSFRVQGSNNDGIWNTEGAVLALSIKPFFYETHWFFVCCFLLVLLMITGFIKLREIQYRKREQLLEHIVQSRTSELRVEKKKTEEQASKLQELDKTKSRFFANVSHEFRTPLTLIIGPLKQMIDGRFGKLPSSVTSQHRMMLRNSHRLLRLINQILDLSKLENGEWQLKAAPVEINPFLEKITMLFRDICATREIELHFKPSEKPLFLHADRDKIEKIFANLLSNAVKFSSCGGHITVSAAETENHILVRFRDNGIGIDPEHLPFVFDRFYQEENIDSRQAEGTGIGLSLVKEFMNLHQGNVEVESAPGKGSCFSLYFLKGSDHFTEKQLITIDNSPLQNEMAADITPPVTKKKPGTASPLSRHDKTKILVVEDNDDLREFICSVLEEQHSVIQAVHGLDALKKMKEFLPDLVVTDIMMPELDGISLNKKLKKDPQTAAIPFVFLTAKVTKEDQIHGLDSGADSYLTKPFDAELLKATVCNLLESRLRLRKLIEQQISTSKMTSPRSEGDHFLQKLNAALEELYPNPDLTVSALSEKIFYDRSSLYRKLKTKTGLNTQQYIQAFRLKKAKMLLTEGAGNISEVAYACGFQSLSYFTKCFKREYDKTPSSILPR